MSTVICFNKPYQVLSQFRDQQQRTTLADFIDVPGVYPAGRLDYDSEGLLLLTDDGQLQHQISHPDAKLEKTYWVEVEGAISDTDLQPLREGIELKDGRCRPASVALMPAPDVWSRQPPVRTRQSIPTRWIRIQISEGRNRQVRRMTAAIGFPTLRLIRAAIGNWTLGDLGPGEYRVETVHARAAAKRPSRSKAGGPRRHSRSLR